MVCVESMRENTMIVTLCKFLMIFFKGTLHITSNYLIIYYLRTEQNMIT